ncbi:MAG: HesA/MoeB/ThiF family protein [Candidatus Bathyarchaeota archaeon]|nr:HesA/MoeB/ThiF family protein [Candidatus Bathyarchaeota archaeon]
MSINDEKNLSDKEIEFYSRQIVLKDVGYNGQLKLKNAKVCLVGVGGLGCPIATQLIAMGIGYLRLIDRDVIELSNLQRQHLYSPKFIGYPKVEVASNRLKELNPYIRVDPFPISLHERNAEELLRGMDVVIDGLDSARARYAINRACIKLKIPYIHGSVITTFGNVSAIIPNETPCLECFYGDIKDEDLPTCATAGVHPSIIGIIASIQVSEVIRVILGEKPLLMNKLLHCDLQYMTFEEMNISRSESCLVCGQKPAAQSVPIKQELVEELCGRSGKRVYMVIPRETFEISMSDLNEFLRNNGFKIQVKANLGITFNNNKEITSSILKSGIAIVEGVENMNDVLDFYNKIIVDGLGIHQSHIK